VITVTLGCPRRPGHRCRRSESLDPARWQSTKGPASTASSTPRGRLPARRLGDGVSIRCSASAAMCGASRTTARACECRDWSPPAVRMARPTPRQSMPSSVRAFPLRIPGMVMHVIDRRCRQPGLLHHDGSGGHCGAGRARARRQRSAGNRCRSCWCGGWPCRCSWWRQQPRATWPIAG